MLQFWFHISVERISHFHSPMLSQSRAVLVVYMAKWETLTSNGSAVALAQPWISLLVAHEPLLTSGPAPRICCRTLKARASLLPPTADWLTTAEWTKLLVLARRISPEERQQMTERVLQAPTFRCVFFFFKYQVSSPPRYWALAPVEPAPLRMLRNCSPTCFSTAWLTPEFKIHHKLKDHFAILENIKVGYHVNVKVKG